MKTIPQGKFPPSFYRVSLKAVIRNKIGEVLLVKEKGGDWTLPGGGIDFGEELEDGLRRELHEEIAIGGQAFTYTYHGNDMFYLPDKERWQMWLVYEAKFDDDATFGAGIDVDEIAFMRVEQFKESDIFSHRMIYKWCVDTTHDVTRY